MELAETAALSLGADALVALGQRQYWPGFRNRKWLSLPPPRPDPPLSPASVSLGWEEVSGGKMVVELVGAFNKLTKRMSTTDDDATSTSTTTTSFRGETVVFDALKLAFPLLRSLPLLPGGRLALTRALSVALLLADLRMDAEVISVALLLHPLRSRAVSLPDVRARLGLGLGTAHLLHDALRLSDALLLHDHGDEAAATALRRYCLTLYDSRAVVVELAVVLDAMTHQLPHLPRYDQQRFSLGVMRVHAPLAHALGLSLPLDDLAFRYLFPYSYLYLDTWLRSQAPANLLDDCRELLIQALGDDPVLASLVSKFTVTSRIKSRYSTMKKLLKDGRQPQQVNDILGIRAVLQHIPQSDDRDGETACYRAREIVRSLWNEVEGRTKDYIANPKSNGYRSLHMAVDVCEPRGTRPLMEIQIRTAEMDSSAVGGATSHSFYKAGLTNPQEAMRLKAIMVAAAELAALRLKELPTTTNYATSDGTDKVFRLLDKNGDGRISMDELREVVEELGAPGEDAQHMMHLLDANSDGSLSSEEFDLLHNQAEFMRGLEDTDDHYKAMLNEKLQFVPD